jgi:creatinine amidohydrolase/Fe(II)-dependent formamide hydrolase-like protein
MPRHFSPVALAASAAIVTLASPTVAQLPTPKPPDTVFLEELTWDELALLIQNGKTTAIIGTAGTEQKGPHMAIGEHKYATEYCADKIARALGNAIVAPIVTYVPEGSWERPTGHMSKAGSITLPEERFRTLLELTARSLRGSGFKEIILIGDSGGNQQGMNAVATKLNAEWKGTGVRLHFIGDYYTKAHAMQQTWLADSAKIIPRDSIGGHANIMDTSELMYIHPELVKKDRFPIANQANGVSGSPAKSTPEIGKKLLDIKIGLALDQIRRSLAAAPAGAENDR